MDNTPEGIEKLLNDLTPLLEQAVGLKSRWSGIVHLAEEVDVSNRPLFAAKKAWDCSIHLHVLLLASEDLLGRLIHESLHAVSAELTPSAFRQFRGYEEGSLRC